MKLLSRNLTGAGRLINTGILLFALFSPWMLVIKGCSVPFSPPVEAKPEIYRGIDFAAIAVYVFPKPVVSPLLLAFMLLLFSILLYMGSNTYESIKPNAKHKPWLWLSLIGSTYPLVFGVFFGERLLWGYWVTCLGLILSWGVELFELVRASYQTKLANRTPPTGSDEVELSSRQGGG